MVIYGTPIVQTFHFKYKLIRIYISRSVYLTWFGCCCRRFFISSLSSYSLTHWKWFQEQLYALRHAWYSEKSPIIIIIFDDDDGGGDSMLSIFFRVGIFQAIFFQWIIIANAFLFYVFVNYCLNFSWEWANRKTLSFEWYACMVIAPYFIYTHSHSQAHVLCS